MEALPFGEGAPVGGGRGAAPGIVLLMAFGEFVLRQSLFRLFQRPGMGVEKSTFPKGEGLGASAPE